MKKCFRIIAAILATTILFSSCKPIELPSEDERFVAFLDELVANSIDENDFTINFLFEHPENFGIEAGLQALPFSSYDDFKESRSYNSETIKELNKFNRSKLSQENRLTLDVILDYLVRTDTPIDFYYLDTSYLGGMLGFQAQLPFMLCEYNILSQSDLDNFCNVLETAEEKFLLYAEHEAERERQGVGLSKRLLDDVIEQCDNFSSMQPTFISDAVGVKIDAADFLTDEEKAEAKERIASLVQNNLTAAYKTLGDALKELSPAEETVGLAHFENGAEYYEWLVRYQTGLEMAPDELYDYVSEKIDETVDKYHAILEKNPHLQEEISDYKTIYTDADSFNAVIDELSEKIKLDFPEISPIDYKVSNVPKELADNFSPAAYFSRRIDASKDSTQSIIVNGSYDYNLYPTLAHEGYPGHMYQAAYFSEQNFHPLRYIISYPSYSEGYAEYVETNIWRYSNNSEAAYLVAVDTTYALLLYSLLDITIHYYGSTVADVTSMLSSMGISEQIATEIYDAIVEAPGNYLRYSIGMLQFADMREYAESKLGNDFNDLKFHEAILKCGTAPFSTVWESVTQYVDSQKEPAATNNGSSPLAA